MAVYTQIENEELVAFLTSYDIGEIRSLKGIAEGIENSNYLLHMTSGDYILTLYEKRVREEDLPFFIGLKQHLAARGVPCPLPVADREGRTLRHLAGRPAAIVTFLEGMSVRRPQPVQCAELGRAMARMHLAAADFPLSRANNLALPGWEKLFEQTRQMADDFRDGLAGELAVELAFLQRNWPKSIPAGVIHADLFPDNVFFLGNKLAGLIDFYFACNDVLAYDIAICLNAWCFEMDFSFNITKARALLKGYQEYRPLSPAETDALPVLARGASLRFLLTRLYDWFNTPDGALVQPKNPREYLLKLQFHRRVSTAAEYGLDF
jgi:homoserine kinase type II